MILISILIACEDSRPELPSVEERVAQSIAALKEQLVEPDFGWRVNYRPNTEAGTFFILLDFDEEGTVRIQSDVPDEGGVYLDQTTSYRIDQELETELVLETYAVFHYLFEQNQNSFGAEFEFLFEGEENGNLIFVSKSDAGLRTELIFEPAGFSDSDLISIDLISQLSQGGYRSGELAGIQAAPLFQFYLPSENLSIFASLDLGNRRTKVYGATQGEAFEDILSAANSVQIDLLTNISFLADEVIFETPASFSLNSESYSFSSFSISDFQLFDTTYCIDDSGSYASFNAPSTSIGSTMQVVSSLFSSHSNFMDTESEFFQISDVFMYDEDDNTIQPTILESFPNSVVFVLMYNGVPRGFTDGTFTGLGWVGVDENNALEFYLREMEVNSTTGNMLSLTLTEGTYITIADSLDERNSLFDLTDQIFDGGTLYATEVLSFDDVYEVFNPCNRYKFFLAE